MEIKANNGKTYVLPKNPKWRKGAPPSIGWWPASVQGFIESIRWWDGRHWSMPVGPSYKSKMAARFAECKEINATPHIEWTDRWW
jgi:hypothetical protein